jgi:hypothetical protein
MVVLLLRLCAEWILQFELLLRRGRYSLADPCDGSRVKHAAVPAGLDKSALREL